MANIENQILGKLRGSVGKLVVRKINGKSFITAKPRSFIPGTDPASVARREKFGQAVRLAKRINKINCLKAVWKKHVSGNATPFNLMIKTNYPEVNSCGLSDNVTLTPAGGFDVAVNSVQLNPSELQIIIDAIGTDKGIDPVVESKIIMISIIYLSDPVNESAKPAAFISQMSVPQETSLSTQLTFYAPLSYQELHLLYNYQDKKGFFCLVTLDVDNDPVHYSATFNG